MKDMVVDIEQNLLSKIDLYHGDINMPEGFEIDPKQLTGDIFYHKIYSTPFSSSRTLDMLHAYIREHINLKYSFSLVQEQTMGDFFNPQESSYPISHLNLVDLKNSPDYIMLYGVDVAKDSCKVVIDYDDNRRKGRTWEIPLETNRFIMFPSTQKYHITKNLSNQINFVLTSTYTYI